MQFKHGSLNKLLCLTLSKVFDMTKNTQWFRKVELEQKLRQTLSLNESSRQIKRPRKKPGQWLANIFLFPKN